MRTLGGWATENEVMAASYGAGALVGGITRFVFGREVVDAAQSAFSDAPDMFPAYLDVPAKPEKADNGPNRALEGRNYPRWPAVCTRHHGLSASRRP